MRLRTPDVPVGTRGSSWPGPLLSQGIRAVVIAALSAALFWFAWIYGNGLRDPRYFDGWVLAGGMALQLSFHIAIRTSRLSPKKAARWRSIHIFLGYLLIAAFISHTDLTLPDTGFEWALTTGFVLVTLSGIFGTYLAWSLQARRRIDDGVTQDRIPALRAELARNVQAVVTEANPNAAPIALPGLPHDSWIRDHYTTHLHDFFQGPRNSAAHLLGSPRALQRLIDDIDSLARYVDQPSQDKLATIKTLIIEKDRLDFARVYFAMSKGWLFVHVPVTYALIVLTVLHILIAYAFSSGDW